MLLEPRDFMVPVVDVSFPEAKRRPITDWSNFEALVPRPSVSVSGMYMEMKGTPSAPIIRHVIRREGMMSIRTLSSRCPQQNTPKAMYD